MRYEETQYGFNYGPIEIERVCSDEEKGSVVILLRTKKQRVQVYVTKTGKIKLYDGYHNELKAC